ncbi:MAG: Uma2 family endonuclease [Pseudanabaena sp. CRU_2_10]|nr:Uma2 family endonuclease [Pseudanabaena sp. CRU_2_10]
MLTATPQLPEATRLTESQQLVLPGYCSWEQFEALDLILEGISGLKITYLDGCVEFMTIGEDHEEIKSIIALLLGLYFLELGIDFIPVGSATRRSREQNVSFEPDESYYLGEKKAHPDLAIEVTFSSGDPSKLEKYRRLGIAEVWFWQKGKISVYGLRGADYEPIAKSELLPDLDFALLERCVLMPAKRRCDG